jgi:plastocyanin
MRIATRRRKTSVSEIKHSIRRGGRRRRTTGISVIAKVTIVVVIIVAIAAAGTIFFMMSSGRSSSSGSNISCSASKPNGSTIAISIESGASNSANGPGYNPDKIVLVIGINNTVIWINNDSAHHTVTTSSAPSGASFNSGDMGPGATYSCTFTQPGTYQYYCKYHSWMSGTIVVDTATTS